MIVGLINEHIRSTLYSIIVNQAIFFACTASEFGGGLYSDCSSYVNISNSMFRQCTGTNGGGCYILEGDSCLTKTTFTNCVCPDIGICLVVSKASNNCSIDYLAVVNCMDTSNGNSGALIQYSNFLDMKHVNTSYMYASKWCPSIDVFNTNAKIAYLHQFKCESHDTISCTLCAFCIHDYSQLTSEIERSISYVLCHDCNASQWSDIANPSQGTNQNKIYFTNMVFYNNTFDDDILFNLPSSISPVIYLNSVAIDSSKKFFRGKSSKWLSTKGMKFNTVGANNLDFSFSGMTMHFTEHTSAFIMNSKKALFTWLMTLNLEYYE